MSEATPSPADKVPGRDAPPKRGPPVAKRTGAGPKVGRVPGGVTPKPGITPKRGVIPKRSVGAGQGVPPKPGNSGSVPGMGRPKAVPKRGGAQRPQTDKPDSPRSPRPDTSVSSTGSFPKAAGRTAPKRAPPKLSTLKDRFGEASFSSGEDLLARSGEWKAAKDAEGQTYYFHTGSKQTRRDMPNEMAMALGLDLNAVRKAQTVQPKATFRAPTRVAPARAGRLGGTSPKRLGAAGRPNRGAPVFRGVAGRPSGRTRPPTGGLRAASLSVNSPSSSNAATKVFVQAATAALPPPVVIDDGEESLPSPSSSSTDGALLPPPIDNTSPLLDTESGKHGSVKVAEVKKIEANNSVEKVDLEKVVGASSGETRLPPAVPDAGLKPKSEEPAADDRLDELSAREKQLELKAAALRAKLAEKRERRKAAKAAAATDAGTGTAEKETKAAFDSITNDPVSDLPESENQETVDDLKFQLLQEELSSKSFFKWAEETTEKDAVPETPSGKGGKKRGSILKRAITRSSKKVSSRKRVTSLVDSEDVSPAVPDKRASAGAGEKMVMAESKGEISTRSEDQSHEGDESSDSVSEGGSVGSGAHSRTGSTGSSAPISDVDVLSVDGGGKKDKTHGRFRGMSVRGKAMLQKMTEKSERGGYEDRLATFKGWPHKTPTPESMAKAGLLFVPSKAKPDLVKCNTCGMSFHKWDPDDDPFRVHDKKSPTCGALENWRAGGQNQTRRKMMTMTEIGGASGAALQDEATRKKLADLFGEAAVAKALEVDIPGHFPWDLVPDELLVPNRDFRDDLLGSPLQDCFPALNHILAFLDEQSLLQAGLTCKSWHRWVSREAPVWGEKSLTLPKYLKGHLAAVMRQFKALLSSGVGVSESELHRLQVLTHIMKILRPMHKRHRYAEVISSMVMVHIALRNYVEAGFLVLILADDFPWEVKLAESRSLLVACMSEVPLEPSARFAGDGGPVGGPHILHKRFLTHKKSLKQPTRLLLHLRAVELFSAANYWEIGLSILKDLREGDFHSSLNEERDLYYASRNVERVFESYFLVEHVGDGWKVEEKENPSIGECFDYRYDFLRCISEPYNRHVHRGHAGERLVEFVERISAQFPTAKILEGGASVPDDAFVRQAEEFAPAKYLRVRAVLPSSFEEADGGEVEYDEEDTALTKKFKRNTNVQVFVSSQPFSPEGAKADNEFRSLWLRRSFFVTRDTFPTTQRSSPVINSSDVELHPIESSLLALHEKNQELSDLTEICSTSGAYDSKFTMALKGVIDAAVQGGLKNYGDAFFVEDFPHPSGTDHLEADTADDLVRQLETAMATQVLVCDHGRAVHRALSPEALLPLCDALDDQFYDLRDAVVGMCKHTKMVEELLSAVGPRPAPVEELTVDDLENEEIAFGDATRDDDDAGNHVENVAEGDAKEKLPHEKDVASMFKLDASSSDDEMDDENDETDEVSTADASDSLNSALPDTPRSSSDILEEASQAEYPPRSAFGLLAAEASAVSYPPKSAADVLAEEAAAVAYPPKSAAAVFAGGAVSSSPTRSPRGSRKKRITVTGEPASPEDMSRDPFCRVEKVAKKGPAQAGGLVAGDELLVFGDVTAETVGDGDFECVKGMIVGQTQRSKDLVLKVVIRRAGVALQFFVTPHLWRDGAQDLLGIKLEEDFIR